MAELSNKRGMSLIEIVIATMMLSIVLLAAGSIYISSIRELNRCTDEAAAQKDAAFVLDHIFLNLMGATGIETLTFPSSDIIVDVDAAQKIKYELSGGNTVNYYPPYTVSPVNPKAIAKADSITLTFNRPLTKADSSAMNNYITVDITVTKDRMTKTFSTGVTLRGMAG